MYELKEIVAEGR